MAEFITEFLELFTYPFVIRAIFAGSLISICAAILGVILVLKHYSLIGHGLSEIGFAALSVSSALGLPPFVISTPVIILGSFIILYVSQKYKVAGDTAIAIASSCALALGVLVTSFTGSSSNAYSWLFGSVLALNDFDVIFAIILSLTVIIIFWVFYNRLFLISYSEEYAQSLGIKTGIYHFMISVMTALVVVSGMRIMGTLLISSIIILPAVTARNISHSFFKLVINSAIISFVCFITGLLTSFLFNISTGACIVLINAILLLTVKITKVFKK